MTKRPLALALGLGGALSLLAAGCEQKPVPRVEPSHGLPPLDPFAAPVGPSAMRRDEHAPTDRAAAALPPGHPQIGDGETVDPRGGDPRAANPHGGSSLGDDASLEKMAPGEIAFDKGTVIAGNLKLDSKLKDKVKPGDTIFIVVRGQATGGGNGPVLAVRRLEAGAFPMPFQIDSRDAMVVGTQMKPPVILSVRVDKDGDAMSKNPGDVTGTVTLKALPAPKLTLDLDTVL